MCGIFAQSGTFTTNDVIESLKKLEYRGYDSAGIAYGTDLKASKSVGRIDNLLNIVNDLQTHQAIAHTRWATNGKPTLENAHPHFSQNNNVCVVHNGIIENCEELKDTYLKNCILKSDTDTEIIADLIELFLREHCPLETISMLMKILKGTYAVVFMIRDDSSIYYFKYKSPLVVAYNDDNSYISSDLYAIPSNAKKYMHISNYGYGKIGKDSYYSDGNRFLDFKITEQIRKYSTYMYSEIIDELEVCNLLLDDVLKYSFQKRNVLKKSKSLVIVGAGSSYYAGLYIAKLYERYYKKHAYVYLASEFLYDDIFINDESLVLFISQSGETADLINAFDKIENEKILFTNNVESTLANMIPNHYDILAKKEYAVCATKSFNQTILLAYMLINDNDDELKEEIRKYKNNIKEMIDFVTDDYSLSNFKKIFFVGCGLDYIISLESALKVKEITYIPCFGHHALELKHGSLSLIDSDTAIIGLSSMYKSHLSNTMNEIKSRGGSIKYVSPKCYSHDLGALALVTYAQLLAYFIAIKKGNDPDHPRNLAKSVTVL